MEHPISKSTQRRYLTRWFTMHSTGDYQCQQPEHPSYNIKSIVGYTPAFCARSEAVVELLLMGRDFVRRRLFTRA